MGKNQAYKAMQRSRVGSSSAGPEEVEDGMVDGSFHSPEWHAARLASLKTSHTITWEQYKQKQKEEVLRQGELEKDTDKLMREYRAQLDAERSLKLSQGRNHHEMEKKKKKDNKKKTKRTKRKKKTSSSSSSSSSSDDDYDHKDKLSKSKSKRCRSKSNDDDVHYDHNNNNNSKTTKRSHRSHKKHKSTSTPDGPVPLSAFFHSANT